MKRNNLCWITLTVEIIRLACWIFTQPHWKLGLYLAKPNGTPKALKYCEHGRWLISNECTFIEKGRFLHSSWSWAKSCHITFAPLWVIFEQTALNIRLNTSCTSHTTKLLQLLFSPCSSVTISSLIPPSPICHYVNVSAVSNNAYIRVLVVCVLKWR